MDLNVDVAGGDVNHEVMQEYLQALEEISNEKGGNGDGVNVSDDEGGHSSEEGDMNPVDYVVDENNVDVEDEVFEEGEYDDIDSGDGESDFVDSDSADGEDCTHRDANNDDTAGEDLEVNSNSLNDSTNSNQNPDDFYLIDDVDDIVKMDMFNLKNEDVSKLRFGSLDVAYKFYCWFAKINGFAVRKYQVIKDKNGDVVQQTFVCNLEGFRQDRGLTLEQRKRGPKHETRCGCGAKFRVHVDINSGRWYITVFCYEHNHDMLIEKHCGLLAAHRKLTKSDKIQITNFGNAGIKVTQMIGAFANAAGGYDKVGFLKKDVHNQIQRQRKQVSSDAKGAVRYLLDLRLKDSLMFVAHTVDAGGRLQHLFWSDGESQKNYEIFGDVLAFDATYKKNKYKCPFVVFSGVNHHNQTIIFATAVVSNEVEGTYVWLLEQFLAAMKGKPPISVITDGDLAMRNAIKRVFPNSYHRLCAWHLLRNAISNIGNVDFIPYFKKCMLGDHEVWKFESLWNEMVIKFGLEENSWIKDMYEKRKMWATAHIRGNFFAGIRTTSRCEAFHSHMGQFVHSKLNMTDFVKQFHRCVEYFRFREVQADHQSQYGQAVLQTSLRSLERSASNQLTKEIFMLVCSVLKKVSLISLLDTQEMTSFSIYSVTKYRNEGYVWRVSHCPLTDEFKCSCFRMESIGIPCEHIVAVLVYLDYADFPKSLVLNRWSQFAKESIRGNYQDGSYYWDSHLVARHANLVNLSKEVSELAYMDVDDYKSYLEYLTDELSRLKSKYSNENVQENLPAEVDRVNILNPVYSRSKGCGSISIRTPGRRRRIQTCGTCGASGHNRRCCPTMAEGELGAACSLQSQHVRLSEDG